MQFGIIWLAILTSTGSSSHSDCAIASEKSENTVIDSKGLPGNWEYSC